jgi:SAM-dependent methyltransferase
MSQTINYRLSPSPSHRDFLILSDLLAWIKDAIPATKGRVLDYGCGDSPYQTLFSGRPYTRADISRENVPDIIIHANETITAPDASYETIISTQVLEHVELFREYLNESYRLLTPGGKLIITTHGNFEEHGHPCDFHRWTLTALARDLENSGFVVERADKLTVGARAVGYHLSSQIWKLNPSRRSLLGFGVQLLRGYIGKRPEKWNKFIDRSTTGLRMQAGRDADESLFVGIAFVARKP